MSAKRIEGWTWILIFVGMALFTLGLVVQRRDATLGWGVAGIGALLVVVGAVLVWVRSRMTNSRE